MAANGSQVKNGKAFEYAIAKEYCNYIKQQGVNAIFIENEASLQARRYYECFSLIEKEKYDKAAYETISTIVKLEPGMLAQKNDTDVLNIYLQKDQEGVNGDVRDIVFSRTSPKWEIGFSAKNNNDAVKHSRLGKKLDFGKTWLNIPCSNTYWNDINPIFDFIEESITHHLKWEDLKTDKREKIYLPILKAFRKEILLLNSKDSSVPQKLILYLIGNMPFYKIIKDDNHKLVIVKAFNINGEMNKTVNGIKAYYTTPKINLPTRIVEFEMKHHSETTLNMILDGGWEISFRLHSASTYVERSLKFDIKLLGNPPILFTQHLFQ